MAPITVYGDVDARAVEQLVRCAEAGDALRGVLCADGHVGYSQPIGGAARLPASTSARPASATTSRAATRPCRTNMHRRRTSRPTVPA